MYVARERGATWTLTPSLKLAAAKMEAPRQPLEKLERVKGIEPSYSAWKSPEFRSFQKPF
jgi:hypothetical protein